MQRGIHSGHCAVLYNEGATSQLFPPQDGGLPKFVEVVNEKLKGKVVGNQAEHMLQISQSIEDTILYSKHEHTSQPVNTPFPLETSRRIASTRINTTVPASVTASALHLLEKSDERDIASQMTGNHLEVICFRILLIDDMLISFFRA